MSTYDEAVKDIKKAVEILDANPSNISTEKHPDPVKHKYISFAKSAVRILAGLALAGGGWLEMNPYIMYAGALLILAEVLGVAEELV
jgi:hypothetical protein